MLENPLKIPMIQAPCLRTPMLVMQFMAEIRRKIGPTPWMNVLDLFISVVIFIAANYNSNTMNNGIWMNLDITRIITY